MAVMKINKNVQEQMYTPKQELERHKEILRKTLLASTELIDASSSDIDYKKITEVVADISGAKYASFNVFDDNGLDFTTVAMTGVNEKLLNATSLLGFEIVNKKWKHDPVRAAKIKDKKITEFETLSDLSGDVIPKKALTFVTDKFGIGRVAVVKIVKGDLAVGDFTLIFEKGNHFDNQETAELFANLVGLLIYRVRAELAAEERVRELVRLNELMTGRELRMAEMKEELARCKEGKS